jgi:calcium-dependent protein kinase
LYQPLEFEPDDWEDVSDEAKELISSMLVKNPIDRITTQEALSHRWFNMMRQDKRPRKTRLISAVNHLRTYKAPNRLKAEGMKILLKYCNEEQVRELREIFLDLDTNKSGFITVNDLRKALKDLGIASAAEEIN